MKTRDQLIADALEKCGGLSLYENATTPQINRAASALTSLLNFLNTKGMPLWKLNEYTYSFSLLASGTASLGVGQTLVTLGIPLKVISASRYDGVAATNLQLVTYTRDEYLNIPAPTATAVPTGVYAKPQLTTMKIGVWPLPDSYWQSNGSLKLNIHEAVTVVANGTDIPDYPNEWEDAIIYNLADRLAPTYGLPIQERSALRAQAKEILDETLAFGHEEGSVYIRPSLSGRRD